MQLSLIAFTWSLVTSAYAAPSPQKATLVKCNVLVSGPSPDGSSCTGFYSSKLFLNFPNKHKTFPIPKTPNPLFPKGYLYSTDVSLSQGTTITKVTCKNGYSKTVKFVVGKGNTLIPPQTETDRVTIHCQL